MFLVVLSLLVMMLVVMLLFMMIVIFLFVIAAAVAVTIAITVIISKEIHFPLELNLWHVVLEELESINHVTKWIKLEVINFSLHWAHRTVIGEEVRARMRMGLITVSKLTNVANAEETENT